MYTGKNAESLNVDGGGTYRNHRFKELNSAYVVLYVRYAHLSTRSVSMVLSAQCLLLMNGAACLIITT
jgi:hypothetical protein